MSPLKVFMNSPPAGESVYALSAQNFFHLERTQVARCFGWLAQLQYVANMPDRKRSHSLPQSHASFVFYSYSVKLRSKTGYGMLPADCCLHKPMPFSSFGTSVLARKDHPFCLKSALESCG